MDGEHTDGPSANRRLQDNVRALMKWRRLTQAQLARRLGISQAAFSKRLSGRTAFQISDLDGIASAFGLSPAELFLDGYGDRDRRGGRDRRTGLDRRRTATHGVMRNDIDQAADRPSATPPWDRDPGLRDD